MPSADLFSKLTFLPNFFRNTIRMSNNLHPDQARRNAGPDLDANCLQRFKADDTSRQSINFIICDDNKTTVI